MKNKNVRILYVLKILKEGSDKYHPITQMTIKRVLDGLGIKCDRRAISRDIDTLQDFGYEIVKIRGGGCYFDSEEFSKTEIDFLVDCIKHSNLIMEEKMKLKNKVLKLLNIYKRKD